MQLSVLNLCRPQARHVHRVIPEIDIWRAATLMLKRYGDKALEQSYQRADELAANGDHAGADTWRRITTAVVDADAEFQLRGQDLPLASVMKGDGGADHG